ncbi:MAG: amidohydrolase family protein [Clostridia bacterium]|nr:amidohydrolase family protein [Clostridia bacterium]
MNNRKIIDTHTHVFPQKVASRAADNITNYYSIPRQGDGRVEGLLAGSGTLSDVRYVISSATLNPAKPTVGDDYMLEVAASDSRFIPLCSFHPAMGVEASVAELDRCFALGAKGVKIHSDFQQFFVDDETAMEVYRHIASCGKPIIFHVGDPNTDFSTPKRVRNIVEKIPDLTVIAAHMCGYSAWEEAKKYLIGTPVYTDTSEALLGMSPAQLCDLIRLHGVERVMFGSDYPLWNPDFAFAQIDALPLTEEEKDLIYYKTAEKVFV